MAINYSFELHQFNEALTPYGTIETKSPVREDVLIENFTEGDFFRTSPEDITNSLTLNLEDRLITLIVDESGSMSWNDSNGDRYTYFTRLLTKLRDTYPGSILTNLIGFGGVLVSSKLLVSKSSDDFLVSKSGINKILQTVFQDSIFDFSGIRIVRRTDRYPIHPADGIIVGEGIFDAIKDENLIEGTRYYYGVWTFNKDLNFSSGKFISGIPQDRILPRGVNFSNAIPRILPGVIRDSNTQIIYNFVEGSGLTCFDSSGNGFHAVLGSEVVEDNFWIGDGKYGVRFDGNFDLLEANIDDNIANTTNRSITVNFWIYRYTNSQDSWIIGTSLSNPTNTIGWGIILKTDGSISFSYSNLSSINSFIDLSGINFIPVKTWTMVTITMTTSGTISLFINSEQVSGTISTGAADLSGMTKLYIGAKPTESGATWSGSDFFGSLSQINIHDTERSSSYIENIFTKESKIFVQNLQNSLETPIDNSQREVLISWDIDSNFDFEGGEIKIVRKYRDIPSNDNDGDIILTQETIPGYFYFLDSFDFVNNSDYYYRIFTYNALGSPCDIEESRLLTVHIPVSPPGITIEPLDSVTNISVINGNKKVLLKWTNPSDLNWKGTKIFFGTNKFPTISISAQGTLEVTDGFEIFDNQDINIESFVHRKKGIDNNGVPIPLENGKFHFYTFVTYNRLSQLSEAQFIIGTPSSSSTIVFPSAEIEDLHLTIVNPETLSVQWTSPVVKVDNLELFFGESALILVSIRDIFGGKLNDLVNISLQVCTKITNRDLTAKEKSLGTLGPGDALDGPCGSANNHILINGGCNHGVRFEEGCNNEQETKETVLKFSTVEDGLIKGILTHISDPNILNKRERYKMSVRSQYRVTNPLNNDEVLFEFNTKPINVSFQHPLDIAVINKNNRQVTPLCSHFGDIRGTTICPQNCNSGTNSNSSCVSQSINGAYINAVSPYIVRVELQYKGEALPNGTPINVQLFKSNTEIPLSIRSNRVSIREGIYNTTSVQESLVDNNGNIIDGGVVNKSIVDIEIPVPSLPEVIDLYISINYLGLFVDAIHTTFFISSLFIQVSQTQPTPNGIDISEQFATVWTIDPDNNQNIIPVADGTFVKWELNKLRFGKNRPFYSIEDTNRLTSGVYSKTSNGIARNIFFGPVANIESHTITVCEKACCIGEEYSIKASVVLGDQTAVDEVYVAYGCKEDESIFLSQRLFLNAISGQGEPPNYIAWADGENWIKLGIARNPALVTDLPGADCFRQCSEINFRGQLFTLPENHIVQVNAPGEIIWNVTFKTPSTSGHSHSDFLESFENIESAETVLLPSGQNSVTAAIPLTDDITYFYVKLNKFIGDKNNPQPESCDTNPGGGLGSSGNVLLNCEWENICKDALDCSPTGVKWTNVSPVSATSTLISDDASITLFGGGNYGDGTPPILVGFKEPLDVQILEVRVNGQRLNNQELIVDGVSQHTAVIEVKFANKTVPDGTIVELFIEGNDSDIINFSNCQGQNTQPGCHPVTTGIIFTKLTNDSFINPDGDKRSLAYFTINPLPNISFNAKINITCRYDKLGTAKREITRCIVLNNTVNVETQPNQPTSETTATPSVVSIISNEAIVYDTTTDEYSVVLGSVIDRIGHFASTNSVLYDTIYLFGGFTDKDLDNTSKITSTSEKYNITTDTWNFITDIPTPRMNGMTVIAGSTIYCIGGLELEPITNQYVVSRKIESFDCISETWNPTLTPMPSNYGVSFGVATYDNSDNIYVLCGLTKVINNNQPDILNDKILRYTISTDTWMNISPINSEEYSRISPFGFFRTQPNPFDSDKVLGYVFGGSIPKSLPEFNAEFNKKLNQALSDFRSFILTSPYYLNLTDTEQVDFISSEEENIKNSITVPPYIYPSNGFKYKMGSEIIDSNGDLTIDISGKLDNEWTVLPKSRDRGQCVYIESQDTVYFMGGSNQNSSTTLNRVESINLSNEVNLYTKLTSFSRGRSLFAAVPVQNEIFLFGGLTSGHKEGFVEIEIKQNPTLIKAQGNQSSGIIITLRDDAGELLDRDIRCSVKGRLRIPEIDSVLTTFLAQRAADRALGGDGSGNAPVSTPTTQIDYAALIKAQNKIIDPNSDKFQFNASKKLSEQLFLFPILYSQQEFVIQGGIGGTTLLPRSEDPLSEFQRLSEFIKQTLSSPSIDFNEKFQGNLTRDELFALGDALKTVKLPPVVLDSNTIRNLYDIETIVTIVDNVYFGQTVSDLDLNIQEEINKKITKILTPPTIPPDSEEETPDSGGSFFQDIPVSSSGCLLLQHASGQQIHPADQPPNTNSPGPVKTGGINQSGQCLFCQALTPLKPAIKNQLSTVVATFYNSNDWVPQIKKRLTGGNSLSDAIEEIDIIDKETPFGASPLYSAIQEAAINISGETFENQKKVIYIGSDNSENFSLISRDEAIEEVNAVDGDGRTPIVYTLFNTSFPVSLSSQLERTEVGDIEKITKATGGQSSTLTSSGFLNQILNLTIGGATGGLGWGQYKRILTFEELTAITDVTTIFELPLNTQGFLRFRYSKDGFNFTDWTEKFEGSQSTDFVDFFAKILEFEITLTTGFSTDITPEYDSTSTGVPKLISIIWGTSGELEDFIFLNSENILNNVQQLAATFEGSIPGAGTVEIGVASSQSFDWRDFQSSARPSLNEFGKTFLLNRAKNTLSLVSNEILTTRDGLLYTTTYGSWDPNSSVSIYKIVNNIETPVLTGFRLLPREGEIYFDNRQSLKSVFKMSLTNNDKMRVGLKLRNRLHTENITVKGTGYIYSTNEEKPLALSQVAPRASNILISPQSPNSGDTISLLYDYVDLNRNKEFGTLIKWFKNGTQLFEINNKANWSNKDLQNNNKLQPNDKIYCVITPSDGISLGTPVYSSAVTIVSLPPTAQDLVVIPVRNGITNARFDTSSIFKTEYSFEVNDEGINAEESGTIIKWFVNGLLFKEGTFTQNQTVALSPKELTPTETGTSPGPNQGLRAHIIGNEILVEVTPKTALITGEKSISKPFSVVNSIPIVSNVKISPDNPTINSTLQLTYNIDDIDIDSETENQTDQSEIRWFISTDGVNFSEKTDLIGDKNIPPVYLISGSKWKARISGFDGLDISQPTESNIITISS